MLHRGGLQVPGAIRGTEACVLAFLRHLDRSRFHPVVLCNNDRHVEVFRAAGAETHSFEFPLIMIDGRHWSLPVDRYLRAMRHLNRIVRDKAVGAIYCSGGVPCQLAIPVAKRRHVPTILHFHHPASRRYHRFWLTKFADRVIFPSQYTRGHSIAAAGLDGTVVLNGIDCRSVYTPATVRNLEWRRSHGIADEDIVVAQVGAFSPNKRHDVLIEGFRIARRDAVRLKLVLIGDGPERPRMERLVGDGDLAQSVIFAGYVPRVADFYRDTVDINVLASDEEGLGLVLLEGGACGLPGIGSDCTGIREVIQDGRTGHLFRQGDAQALAQKLLDLATSAERRVAMGRAARDFVADNFSEERYAAGITAVIDDVISASRSR